MIEPRDNSLHGLDRWHCGEYRPTEHQDRKAQRSRGLDLAVGRSAAAVLGHDDFEPALGQQRALVGFAIGTATNEIIDMRQIERWIDRIDAANDIIVLRRRHERCEFLAAERKEYAMGCLAQRIHCGRHVIDLDPPVALDRHPRRPPQCKKANARQSRSMHAVCGDRAGVGMGRIDERFDALYRHITGEPLGAAEAADPYRYAHGGRRRGAAGERERDHEVATTAQALRKLSRLPCAAQNENAHAAS